MAKPSAAEEKKQEQNIEIRKALANAYAFVEGQKSIQAFSSLTVEDLLDQQIEIIEGKDTQSRPNALNKVTRTVNDLQAAITKIKSLPDDAFVDPEKNKDVNTPAETSADDEVL